MAHRFRRSAEVPLQIISLRAVSSPACVEVSITFADFRQTEDCAKLRQVPVICNWREKLDHKPMHSAGAALMRRRPVFLACVLTLLAGCSLFSRSKPESAASDATLQAEVSHALGRDPALRGQRIIVQSCEGVIDLSGTVKSLAVKSRAGLVAASIPGVVQVRNDLLSE